MSEASEYDSVAAHYRQTWKKDTVSRVTTVLEFLTEMPPFDSRGDDGVCIGGLVNPFRTGPDASVGCARVEGTAVEGCPVVKNMCGTSGIWEVGFIDLPISEQAS